MAKVFNNLKHNSNNRKNCMITLLNIYKLFNLLIITYKNLYCLLTKALKTFLKLMSIKNLIESIKKI